MKPVKISYQFIIRNFPITFLCWSIFYSINLQAEIIDGELNVDGVVRSYHIFIPENIDPSKRYPAVFVFHGGDGDGSSIMRFTCFNDLAEQEKFIAIYPDGYHRNWNDGRIAEAIDQTQDDVKFISLLIADGVAHHQVDSARVFATGISNGGIFSLYLAQKLSNKILAVAAVCASVPKNEVSGFPFPYPLSVMIINGTEDPILKYDGGFVVSEKSNRGEVISTEDMIRLLRQTNHCTADVDSQDIPNINLKDNCTAMRYKYSCEKNRQLVFIKVTGGGHTWPGGIQYLPRAIIGYTCKDFNATSEIWNFFKAQPSRNGLH